MMGVDTVAVSTGSGDFDTEAALEWELEMATERLLEDETNEQYRYSPFDLHNCSGSSVASSGYDSDSTDSLFSLFPHDEWDLPDYSDLPGYDQEIYAWYMEYDELLTVEQRQEEEDDRIQMHVLMEREAQEWPEQMSRQWDETQAQFHRRWLVLDLVRQFLSGRG